MNRIPLQITKYKFLLNTAALVCRSRPLTNARVPPSAFPLAPAAHFSNISRYPQHLHPAERPRLSCPRPPGQRPPPPPRPWWFWAGLATLASTIGFAVYAKSNPEVRDLLTIYAPWFDDFIAFLFMENYDYIAFFKFQYGEMLKRYEEYKNIPEECCGPPVEKPLPCDPCAMRIEYERKKKECFDEEEPLPKPCDVPRREEIPPREVCDLEECIEKLESTALKTLEPAIKSTKEYNELVPKELKLYGNDTFKNLYKKLEDKDKTVEFATKTSDDVKERLRTIKDSLYCGAVTGDPEKIEAMREKLEGSLADIEARDNELEWEVKRAKANDNSWQMVEKEVKKFQADLCSFYTKLDFEKKSPPPNIDGEELDFLLIHAQKFSKPMKKKLDAATDAYIAKIDRGLASLDESPEEKKAREKKVEEGEKKAKEQLKKDIADREKNLRDKLEKHHKASLEEQKVRLKQEEERTMKKKEQEINAQFDREVEKGVKQKRLEMKEELAELQAKLSTIEEKFGVIKKKQDDTKKAQKLYEVGLSMLNALRKNEELVRVDEELAELKKTAENDKLVETVYKSIPSSVGERGLLPEKTLKMKYREMEDVALKISLIEETGGSYPLYFVSWLQAKLLGKPKLDEIPPSELKNPPQNKEDFDNFDTFDMMTRARYYVDRGNIAGAMPYINNLQGASRKVADNWYSWAQGYVSTKQAAEAIVAHATALGMKTATER